MEEGIELSLIIGIFITMLFSAFFSGMEIAFVSSNRMLAEMDRIKKGFSQRILSLFYAHPNGFVSTMLVGNNIALVVYGVLMARLFDKTIFVGFQPAFTVPADTVLSTFIVLFTGEFLPKMLFKSNPNRLMAVFSIPAGLCYIVLWPISRVASTISKGLLRLFGVKLHGEKDEEEFTKIDLDYLVQSSIDSARNDEDIEDEVKIFQNALDFGDVKVRDCMVPRTEVVAVGQHCEMNELRQKFIESGHSKIIIYDGDIDHVVGYVHSSEMFRIMPPQSSAVSGDGAESKKSNVDWADVILSMPFVPETMVAQKLMGVFLRQRKSLAVVVDEFGGTSGIVSLEDIVEEIFGDIEDEHDSSNYVAKHLDNGEFVLSARLEIDKVNEMFELSIPESDEYMTIGGFILHGYGSFPKLNEEVCIGKYCFKILKSTMTKIELVRLRIKVDE